MQSLFQLPTIAAVPELDPNTKDLASEDIFGSSEEEENNEELIKPIVVNRPSQIHVYYN